MLSWLDLNLSEGFISMASKAFGMIMATAVSTMLAAGAQAQTAGDSGKTADKPAGKCVHNCSGNAECKGNGNNNCKGKNSCSNEGLVPKACSSKKTKEECKTVLDAKKNRLCTWNEG
jgi:hypothetical protein